MKKTEVLKQGEEKGEERKTGFTMDEYDKLMLDLDFIVASLQVSFNHDQDEYDVRPIIHESINRGFAVQSLIESMGPAVQEVQS